MISNLFFNLILVLKNFYIKTKLQFMLLKFIRFIIFAICLSLFFPIYFTSPVVSGLTMSANTSRERCGDGQHNDSNRLDENCPIDFSSVGTPAANFNKSKTLRLAVVGDIDSNQGLTTQLEIANHYNVQVLIIPGDLEYSNGNEVLSNFQTHGFTRENTDIVVGNHDFSNDLLVWLGKNRTFGEVKFDFWVINLLCST